LRMPRRRTDWDAFVAKMPDSVRQTLGIEPWESRNDEELGPVEEIAIAGLTWLLELPLWGWRGEPFQVTPNQVAADPQTYAVHYARVMWSDLDDPIVIAERNGRTVLLDGYHRLLRAMVEGRRTLPARRRRS
jgi:hypothetical protein